MRIFDSLLIEETYDLLKEYNNLREAISLRIVQLDDFFEVHFGEETIEYFELARLKLKKLLMYDLHTVNKINEYFLENLQIYEDEYNLNQNASQNTNINLNMTPQNKTILLTSKSKNTNNYFDEPQHKAKEKIIQENRTCSISKSSKNTEKNNNGTEQIKTPKGPILSAKQIKDKNEEAKMMSKLEQVKKAKEAKEAKEDQSQIDKSLLKYDLGKKVSDNPFIQLAASQKSNTNWPELTFKLQLTENEYKLLVLEKANRIKLI